MTRKTGFLRPIPDNATVLRNSEGEPRVVAQVSPKPEHSVEAVMEALAQALDERRARGESLEYFHANKAWRQVIRSLGWTPGNDAGHGDEYLVTITHPGAGNAYIRLNTGSTP